MAPSHVKGRSLGDSKYNSTLDDGTWPLSQSALATALGGVSAQGQSVAKEGIAGRGTRANPKCQEAGR